MISELRTSAVIKTIDKMLIGTGAAINPDKSRPITMNPSTAKSASPPPPIDCVILIAACSDEGYSGMTKTRLYRWILSTDNKRPDYRRFCNFQQRFNEMQQQTFDLKHPSFQ